MDNDILATLAKVLGPAMDAEKSARYGLGLKHDSGGSPISAGYSHGPGGLLTFPGVDQNVFHTVLGNYSLLSQIPATPSRYTDPTYFTLTGVQATSGSEPDGVCDDPPTAGLMKGCLTTAPFGRYERATPELEVNRLGQRVDRADPIDLRLIGNPMLEANPVFNSGPGNANVPGALFNSEVARKFWELGLAFHRLLSQQLWDGNPTNNTGAGGYKELTGIPQLVNTGYVDAETGQTCPASDSYISNFAYERIDSADGAANVVAALTDMYYQLRDRAIRGGVMPVRWVIAMRPQLFYEITKVWPLSYLVTGNTVLGAAGTPAFTDTSVIVRMRDEMRSGRYLMIDGDRVDVVLDDAIGEATNTTNANVTSGCFGTSIYFLPMSVVGGQSSLFLEYLDFDNPDIRAAMGQNILGRVEGAFITWPKQTNLCISWGSKIEPRLVLRTPWLAGRLQNVVYCPTQHTRESFPDDPYFTNGGRTSRTGPSYYSVWKSNPATN